jgi:hypothetical protein
MPLRPEAMQYPFAGVSKTILRSLPPQIAAS